ncbi:MAG: four helix bundle protein [Clostridia bacterium]|nr:four helix bundle protein [Clostridia bacterium]
MTSNQLVVLSKAFAVDLIKLFDTLKRRGKAAPIISQMLRSGTSIGANIHEANYASSKADFVNKFQIALKECYETDYWLEIFHDALIITDDEYLEMSGQCRKIRRLLIASIKTAKRNIESDT